jgi:replicative DNA helicase
MPANVDAERAVLGALLIDSEAISEIASFLKAEDFYRERHRAIYAARLDLYERNEPGDFVTLVDELRRRNQLDAVGGAAYLTELINDVPTAVHVEYYAHIVERCAIMRRLIGAGGQIAGIGYENPSDVDDALDRAEQELFRVSQRRVSQDFTTLRDALHKYFDTIEYLHQHKGEVVGVPSGFHDLDQMTGGLHASDLLIIAGRPGVGKTGFALSVVRNVAARFQASAAIFSLEMSTEQLVQRLLCMEAAVDSQRIRTGFIDEFEWRRISEAFGVLSEAPIYIDDTPGLTTNELRMKARRLKAEHDLKLLVVDYLQLMQGRGLENRVQEVSEISRGLKALARELDIPVIALSQLSRAVESRQDHRPMLSDLRESGCLTGDTLIWDPVTGIPRRIDSLVGNEGDTVLALDDRYRLVQKPVLKAWCSGVKKVYELTLASGRRIKASANHPFLTIDGWAPLGELTVGTALATPRYHPEPIQPVRMDESKLILLAHLLGDGCTVPRQPIHYTSADPACIDAVASAASTAFGITPRVVRQENWWHVYLPSPTRLTHGKHHPITDWLNALGVGLRRAPDKVISDAVFALPNEQLALFLRHLWATDGSVNRSQHTNAVIYYATRSRTFAEQVQFLLQRFNIVARIKVAHKANYRANYQVQLSSTPDHLRFLRSIGCYGQRGHIVSTLIDELSKVVSRPNVDVIPTEVWAKVQQVRSQQGIKLSDFAKVVGHVAYVGGRRKSGVGRDHFDRIASVFGDDGLRNLASPDVFWDRIESIEALDERDVYDLTVAEFHNFVANGLVVKNSIEQDADIVMFIHREELYKPDTDRKNIADIILAKHRNGPVGQVPVRFFPSQTRFADLEVYRQPDN